MSTYSDLLFRIFRVVVTPIRKTQLLLWCNVLYCENSHQGLLGVALVDPARADLAIRGTAVIL